MRPNINCSSPWNLASASGVTGRVVGANGKNRLELVINYICLWNLASASGKDRRIVFFLAEYS